MARYDFMQAYPGPNGPHLACRTQFTQTRDESKRGGDSIHPRVMNGRTLYRKENTCAAPSGQRIRRVIAALAGHCERHPNDSVSKDRLSSLSA